ncbi:MAG: sodium:solute symporter [Chloroflexia bacterium]|nr:sodium:solute symporter [Chloroflexia bacterium]
MGFKQNQDFARLYACRKSLSSPFVGVTLFATWFGSNHIMGNPEYFVTNGFSSFFSLVISGGIALFTVGYFYAKRLYRLNIVTVGDFFKTRFNQKIDFVVSVILVLAYPLWIASQFVALGYLFQNVLGVTFSTGVLISAILVIVYTYIGGMWAVSYTDMVQSILILLGLIFILIVSLNQLDNTSLLFQNKPNSFFSILPQNNVAAWSEYIAVILALYLGSIPGQEIYQRVFSAKSEKAAVNGLYLAAFLIVVIPIIPAMIALIATTIHPDLITASVEQNIIATYVLNYTSLPIQILFYGALISAILSTASGALLAPATIISENIIRSQRPKIKDKHLLFITRISVILIAFVAVYFAFRNTNIVGLLVASLNLILVCIFAPMTFGLFWSRSSTFGAWSAIVVGGLIWLVCIVLKTTLDPIIYGTPASCLAMILGSLITPDRK